MTAASFAPDVARRQLLRTAVAVIVGLVVTVAVPPANATYPGSNGLLAYAEYHCEEGVCHNELRTVGARGTRNVLVETTDGVSDPSWSPDGRRIVYSRPATGHIWIVNADGSGKRRVTRSPALNHRRPTFSPNGRRILYGTRNDNERGIAVSVRLDGSDRRVVLRRGRGDVAEPVYSPNGNRIAFELWADNATDELASGIYTARVDGTGMRRITGVGNHDRRPTWSPDGQWLAFYRINAEERSTQVYRVRADGTGLRQLTNVSASAVSPAWSPNGRRILYVVETVGNDNIWSMRANGSDHRREVGGRQITNDPEWQPR